MNRQKSVQAPFSPASKPSTLLRAAGKFVNRVTRALLGQIVAFGVVGTAGILVNVLIFNLLMLFGFNSLPAGSILAALVAIFASISFNWIGNRYLVFSALRRDSLLREALKFFAVSLSGSIVQIACLVISHYVLGFTSILADNIANTVIGLPLATTLRFLGYYFWVFGSKRTKGKNQECVTERDTDSKIVTELIEV